MGMIKDGKVGKLTEQAQQAYAGGHYFFTPMLNSPAFKSAGWMLAHWAVTNDQHGKPQAYPLFRRRA